MSEPRTGPTIRCFIPAATDRGNAVIDELSPLGGTLTATFTAEVGEVLSLLVGGQSGWASASIRATVERVWDTPLGCRLFVEFVREPGTAALVRQLFERVAGPPWRWRRSASSH